MDDKVSLAHLIIFMYTRFFNFPFGFKDFSTLFLNLVLCIDDLNLKMKNPLMVANISTNKDAMQVTVGIGHSFFWPFLHFLISPTPFHYRTQKSNSLYTHVYSYVHAHKRTLLLNAVIVLFSCKLDRNRCVNSLSVYVSVCVFI